MLRTVLRHAGGVRVDHVIGLFRLWWVPEGRSAAEGTYVRYDHEALVGILALEAWRAGAVVVGEDLGTVEPWVRDYLADRGLLGTSILWFERDDARRRRGRPSSGASCAWHRHHPRPAARRAGYLAGEHVGIRDDLGLLTRPVEEERGRDEADRASLARRCSSSAAGSRPTPVHDVPAVTRGPARALAATPSRLLGVALADAVGETARHEPARDRREYPNWQFPLPTATATRCCWTTWSSCRSRPSWLPQSAATGPPSTVSP